MQESSERSLAFQSPASVDAALPPQGPSSYSLLNPTQQQTLAMATHIPISHQPTPMSAPMLPLGPMQSFSMHVQTQPSYSPAAYPIQPPAASNPMLQHYLQQQQAMIAHQQHNYQQAGSVHSAITPGSTAPSPGYWNSGGGEESASPGMEVDADGEDDGIGGGDDPNRTFSVILNSPETFVHNASLAPDTQSVHLPISMATAAEASVQGSSRSGNMYGEGPGRRTNRGMESILPSEEAPAVLQGGTARKRAVPSNATKSSSKRTPGKITFVGGPSKREAMLMQQREAAASGSRKRASPNVGDEEYDGDVAEGSGRRNRRKTSGPQEDGGEPRTLSGLSASFAAAYTHIHVTNIPCPHPECAFTADVNGSELARIYATQGGKKKGKCKASSLPYPVPRVRLSSPKYLCSCSGTQALSMPLHQSNDWREVPFSF